MRKSVSVGGRKIPFEFTIFTLVIYKREYFCEFLQDLQRVSKDRLKWILPETALDCSEDVYKILWALAKTANETIPTPEDFLEQFDKFPVFDIWDEIYEDVILKSIRYDKKYKLGEKNNSSRSSVSTEEIVARLMGYGMTLHDLRDITVGMGINLMHANRDIQRISNGETVPDYEKQYRVLKAQEKNVEEKYKNGEITKQKYDSFKEALRQWEEV